MKTADLTSTGGRPGMRRLLLLSLILAVLILIPHFTTPERLPLPACAFKSATGLSCPTCGLTHAWFALFQGKIAEAIRFHTPGVATAAIAAGYLIMLLLRAIGFWRVEQRIFPGLRKTFLLAMGGGWLIFWLLRMFYELG